MTTTVLHGGTAPLAALTTIFTLPCASTYLLTTTRTLSALPTFPTQGNPTCVPAQWTANIAGGGFQYYSPAICPRGFSVGESCSVAKFRTQEGFPASARGETAAWCVPTSMTCTSDTSDFRGGIWGFIKSTSAAGAVFTVGPAIQIRWQQSDLTNFATHPLTPGLAPAALSDGSVVSTPVALSLPTVPGTLQAAPGALTSDATSQDASEVTVLASAPSEFSGEDVYPSTTPVDATTIRSSVESSVQVPTSTQTDGHVETASVNISNGVLTNQRAGIGIILTLSLLLLLALFSLVAIVIKRRRQGGKPNTAVVAAFRRAQLKISGNRDHTRRYNVFWRERKRFHQNPDAERDPNYYQELEVKESTVELGPAAPRGTSENPAELDGATHTASARSSLSWMAMLLDRAGFSTIGRIRTSMPGPTPAVSGQRFVERRLTSPLPAVHTHRRRDFPMEMSTTTEAAYPFHQTGAGKVFCQA